MTHPLYFIEHRGLREHYFLETDRDSNSRKAVLDLIRTGEAKPIKVLEVNDDEGIVRDVTEELLREIRAELHGPTDDDLIADRLAARQIPRAGARTPSRSGRLGSSNVRT